MTPADNRPPGARFPLTAVGVIALLAALAAAYAMPGCGLAGW